MNDHFAAHASLLKAKQDGKKPDPMDINEPIPGWYRGSVYRTGPLLPIIITRELDPEWGSYTTRAFLGGLEVPVDRVWPYCVRNPVPKDWHDAYAQGKGWPDVHIDAPSDREAIGGNNPPTDPAEVLRDQIEAAAAGVKEYATITDAEHAARAQTLRSRLTGLATEAETARKAEKEPHLNAGRDVDAKWAPIASKAASGAKAIRDALSAWETAELRKAQAEHEAKQKASAAAEKALADAGRPIPPGILGPSALTPMAATKIKGGAGRAASGKTINVVDESAGVDYLKLFSAFQDNAEVKELLIKLANKALKVGATQLPGIIMKQVREVK